MKPQTIIIGLDCAPPALVFDRLRDKLPNLSRLMASGMWGPLRSTKPPITVPAWACMTTGKDPGELGLYGFRNRVQGTYELSVANAEDIHAKQLWDWIGDAGFQVASLFVPHCFPPSHIRGHMISGCMTPSLDAEWATPADFEREINKQFGPYIPDIENFRFLDKPALLKKIFEMTEQHFAMASWVLENKKPDFLMMVEMGPDRLHHGFWSDFDPLHPRFVTENPYQNAARDYYTFLDQRIGELLQHARKNCNVMVVSDHGAKAMQGGFCINQWLIDHGWLVLKSSVNPEQIQKGTFDKSWIDWSRTQAWGEGGYYGRIFLNVKGREPEGAIVPKDYSTTRNRLAQEISQWFSNTHTHIKCDLDFPQNMYRKVLGQAPDVFLFLGDLDFRIIGTLGHESLFVLNNDRGSDSCNHDWNGIGIFAGPAFERLGEVSQMEIQDVAKTALRTMHIQPPPGLFGKDWSTPA